LRGWRNLRAARKLDETHLPVTAGSLRNSKNPPTVWEIAAMKTLTRILRSLYLGSGASRRGVGECQAGAARLAYGTLAVVLAMSGSLVHAQVPTCAAPGCNSVTSDGVGNTATGTAVLVNLSTGSSNTASGDHALHNNTTGTNNTASGVNALSFNTTGSFNAAFGSVALQLNTTGDLNTAFGDAALQNNTTGHANTASGVNALSFNTTGSGNTASGVQALEYNTTGDNNTASGSGALFLNTTGYQNTATGASALWSNTTGINNTASGLGALYSNTTGTSNTASGVNSLHSNDAGTENTASGMNALFLNKSGIRNTADGYNALYDNTYGSDNTASGFQALNRNSGGNQNTAAGYNAVFANVTGNGNTGVGYLALFSNTTGLNNIGMGANAGYAVTGSNNIDIGSTGSAGESGVIRIGGPFQSAAYMAGISSTQLTGSAVYVTANGQLGVLASSERYKTEIASIGASTQKLHELRPVSFHLKSDPKGTVQYGLIAEEVNKVFPELVIRDEAGTIQGVRYDELAPMLLSEMQKQELKIDAQAAEISELKRQLAGIQAALVTLQPKDQLFGQR
jgi:hypothetical protein